MKPVDMDVLAQSAQVTRLDTGYWLVRFDHQRFVQWPVDRGPTIDDAFHCGIAEVCAAGRAVRRKLEAQ